MRAPSGRAGRVLAAGKNTLEPPVEQAPGMTLRGRTQISPMPVASDSKREDRSRRLNHLIWRDFLFTCARAWHMIKFLA